jgi:uncharacterized protein
MPSPQCETDDRLARLMAALRALPPGTTAAVAFSGGADSAFLLAAATRALGPSRVVAVTAVSASLAPSELTRAREFAAGLGVRHLTPDSNELSRPGYVENSSARCFHCKTEVIDVVHRSAARIAGQVQVMTGTNADDLRELHRPGIAAARRLGASAPLHELTKEQVREVSRQWGLATWDKPAQACLASRVAYGVAVTPDALLRVSRSETALRNLFAARGWSVTHLRVRDLGDDAARIEVDLEQVATVSADRGVIDVVAEAGFTSVTVDPRGFRSGSLNEALSVPGGQLRRPSRR